MADDESQIIELLEHKSKCINIIDDKWISEWAQLIEKYFHHETRNHIRLKAIALLSQIFSKYHVICEDELMNKILLPHFNDVDQELDPVVRRPIVHLMFDIASACLSYKHCNATLAIVRKILNKPFKQKNIESVVGDESNGGGGLVYIIGNIDIIDSRLIITNLNKLFKTKLHRLPIDPAVNMLDICVNYLNLTYKCPLQDPTPAEIPMIRRELFTVFLNLRCNKYGHLGVLNPNQTYNEVKYSPFIICVKRPARTPASITPLDHHQTTTQVPPESPTNSPTNQQPQQFKFTHLQQYSNAGNIFVPNASQPNCPIVSRCVNLDSMFAGIIECINQETDQDVLKLVLDGLPGILANKPLVMTTTEEKINQLCLALSDLTRSSKVASNSSGSSGGVRQQTSQRIDLVKSGLRCLTSMLIYRRLLDHKSIKVMLAAFEDSLKVSRHPIVPLFTTCLIELQDSSEMTKFLPVVLNRLSKFSPTLNLGISMLEFLSYLILFPKLYENFSDDEYKFIFAIALPYTNPFRFSDYITCLAFRVIAMWYLNCRPSLRCAFIEFVKRSLQSNVIQPFKENPSTPLYSQTSSPITQTPPITYFCPPTMSPVDQRKRSASLNTENSFRAQQAAFGLPNPQLSLQVNEELIETFADLLSRYTHGQSLAIAPKNRSIEMLVDRSTSQTWLHGNSLVTITSGRSSNGWAEIMIRRPTGNTSWVGLLQNTLIASRAINQKVYLNSLNFGNDIISLFSTMSLTKGDNICELIDEAPDYNTHPSSSSMGGGSSSAVSTPTPSSNNNLSSFLASSLILSHTNSTNFTSASNTSLTNLATQQTPLMHQQQASIRPSHIMRDPIPLPKDKKFDVALSCFDHITPYETHKVGVIYVARNQVENRTAILANKCGSTRYYDFLSHIGTCIILKDIDPEIYFIGGLDVNGDDGKYAYFWKDNVTQVIFHVATFMPGRESDPQCNNKNRHIGNDHVCIVYNDSGQQFHLSTIKGTGQFIMAVIVITPLEEVTNLVDVEVLPDLKYILGDIEPKVLSNLGASLYARQLAIHLNLASKIFERRQREGFLSSEPYVSNWVERLRCIKRIRQRLDDSRKTSTGGAK